MGRRNAIKAWCLLAHQECDPDGDDFKLALATAARAKDVRWLAQLLERRTAVADFARGKLEVLSCNGQQSSISLEIQPEVLRTLASTKGARLTNLSVP
jgi:hypothetical protein